MEKTFTQQDLIRFLYKETTISESRDIEQVIEEDWVAREEYEEIKSAAASLPKVEFSPSDRVLSEILRYSRVQLEEMAN